MTRHRTLAWRYWFAMAVLLAAEVAGCTVASGLLIALGAVQWLHFAARERSLTTFPVQVRGAYLGLLLAGLWPPLQFVHWIQLAGTTAFVVSGYCPLARTLALMPWNRTRPFTLDLAWRAYATPPVAGSIVNALDLPE